MIVNTAVIVRDDLARADRAVAVALAAFGAGSMIMAFLLPRILRRRSDRSVMISAGVVMASMLAILGVLWGSLSPISRWPTLLISWLVLGAAYASLVTPGGRLLRRSSHEADRPALFAAQFSLSHVCWLVAYPVVGWLGSGSGVVAALWAMAGLAAIGVVIAIQVWPAHEPEVLAHTHGDLPADHPHLLASSGNNEGLHSHEFVIDSLHTRWPG